MERFQIDTRWEIPQRRSRIDENHPDFQGDSYQVSAIKSSENLDRCNDRTLFVGGISLITKEDLTNYFKRFGVVENVRISMDPLTGRSREYAFIVFKSSYCIRNILQSAPHFINDKKINTQLPKQKQGKIFVGGTSELTKDSIEEYFKKFGAIVDIHMPFDWENQKNKNFCFVIFQREIIAEKILKYNLGRHLINNISVTVKAVKKPISQQNDAATQHQQQMYSGPSWNQNLGYNGYRGNNQCSGDFSSTTETYNTNPMFQARGLPTQPTMLNKRRLESGRGNNIQIPIGEHGFSGAPQRGNSRYGRFQPY